MPSSAGCSSAACGHPRLPLAFDYHAIITDRTGGLLDVEADHRRYVEHVICDLEHHCGLAHLPSGRLAATAAWLALTAIADNLAPWTAHAAGLGPVTTAACSRVTPGTECRGACRDRLPWGVHGQSRS